MVSNILPFVSIVAIACVFTVFVNCEDLTTTPSTETTTVVPSGGADIAAKKKAEREERKQISNSYQSLYFKMCAETFNKMKSITEVCSKEMNMVS